MLNLLIYAAVAIFVLVLIAKFVKYSTMPVHLRWEIYPVPHDPRHEHGGSYYEEVSWWAKPRQKTLAGELKEMLMEMLFIKRIFTYKRSLWWLTYPFHTGIYLILLWFVLLFVSALIDIFAVEVLKMPAYYLTLIVGSIAIVLLLIFSLALLIRRISDWELRNYSSFLDYFNLIFIFAVVATGVLAWQKDVDFTLAKNYMKALITFSSPPAVSLETQVHIVLLSLLLIYLPFTKMTHFLAKWFTYHKILWEDEPVMGSEMDEKLKKYLTQYKVKWSAPHIDPNLSWAEEATKCDLAGRCEVKL
uniref:Nitrate reductase n=1 Tax=Archaeoglobus fulgidus TaxID=2234 RepID=A0A7J2THL8_ARCFL